MQKLKMTAAVMAIFVLLFLMSFPVFADEPINVMIQMYTDNKTIMMTAINFPDAQPFVDENDRTLVPIRAIAENMQMLVDWEEATETVTVRGYTGVGQLPEDGGEYNSIIVLKIGENIAWVDGEQVTFDTKAILKDDRTYVPLRFITENMGACANYKADTNEAIITMLSFERKKAMVDFATAYINKMGKFDYLTAPDGFFDGLVPNPAKSLANCRQAKIQNNASFTPLKAYCDGQWKVEGIITDYNDDGTIKQSQKYVQEVEDTYAGKTDYWATKGYSLQ